MKDVTFLTLKCINKDCLLNVRVGRLLNRPALAIGSFMFCPLCGSKAYTTQDHEETYWEEIAKAYEMPVEIMRMLYDTWDSREHNKFRDHVDQMLKEVVA